VIYLFVSPLHNFGSRNSEAFSLECYCCVSHAPFGGEISSILVYISRYQLRRSTVYTNSVFAKTDNYLVRQERAHVNVKAWDYNTQPVCFFCCSRNDTILNGSRRNILSSVPESSPILVETEPRETSEAVAYANRRHRGHSANR